MEKTSRTLEITVLSAEDLCVHGKPISNNAFVTVRSDSQISSSTKIDKEGGSYPTWTEKLAVNLPAHARFLTVEACRKTYSGDKLIGVARIPVSDFIGGYVPVNYLHFLSYRLRDGKGLRNGIINLSVRVKVPEMEFRDSGSRADEWSRVCEKENDGRVVTGVPVGYRYPA